MGVSQVTGKPAVIPLHRPIPNRLALHLQRFRKPRHRTMLLTDLSFDAWIEHAFAAEVRSGRNPWFFDDDCDWWDPPAPIAVAHITRLFADPQKPLHWFADAQIAQGLTYLFSISATGAKDWLSDPSTPVEKRLACVHSIFTLFERLFAPRCSAALSHLSEAPAGTLNCVCYMWWDEFIAIAHPDDRHFQTLHEAALDVMEKTLRLNSPACQEAALHGLGHWRGQFSARVEDIVSGYLAANPHLESRLQRYASAARSGCVL